MHELPPDLTNSLKSFRGSMSGRNTARHGQDVDLEKGEGGTGPDEAAEDEESPPPSEPQDDSSVTKSQHMNGNAAAHQSRNPGHSQANGKQSARQNGTAQPLSAPPKSSTASTTAAAPLDKSVFHAPPVRDPDPAADRLAENETPLSDEDFHQLMGMRRPTNPDEQEDLKYPFKLATKHGLYRE